MMVNKRGRKERIGRKTNLVTPGMMENVVKQKRTVKGCISATSVAKDDTREKSVENNLSLKCLKYLEHSVWTNTDTSPSFSPTACYTLTAERLPQPSPNEFLNFDAIDTIWDNPELFKIVTPINVLKFEELLKSHPNQPFVESACTSLHEGFWPWVNTKKDEYPVTWDFSERPPEN